MKNQVSTHIVPFEKNKLLPSDYQCKKSRELLTPYHSQNININLLKIL